MTPKQSNGSWRGPCPFKDVSVKYIWHLLARVIGQRHFKHLIWKIDIVFTFPALFHYAVNMMNMLMICQFINAGLISIHRTNSRSLFLLLVILFLIEPASSSPNIGTYNNDGIRCHATTCRAGFEPVLCTEDGGTDSCRPCPADKYQEEDNVLSSMKLFCYSVNKMCMPDTQHLVQTGQVSAANPPKCQCDTTRNFHQMGNDPDDCRRRYCATTEQLLLNGSCECKEGRIRTSKGLCVWKTEHNDLSTTAVPNRLISTSPDLNIPDVNTGSNKSTAFPGRTSPDKNETNLTATTTPTVGVKENKQYITIVILTIVSLIAFAMIVALIFGVRRYLKKRSSQKSFQMSISNGEDNQQQKITVKAKTAYVQMGTNKIVAHENDDEEDIRDDALSAD